MHAHILRVHSGFCRKEEERLYRCPDCPCSFRKVGSLNAHAVRFHSAEVQGMEGHSTVVLSLREGGGKVRSVIGGSHIAKKKKKNELLHSTHSRARLLEDSRKQVNFSELSE